jgi:hypothetical protein
MHTRIQALEDEHYNLLLPFNLALEINEAITNQSNTTSASNLHLVGAMQGTTCWGWWWWGGAWHGGQRIERWSATVARAALPTTVGMAAL